MGRRGREEIGKAEEDELVGSRSEKQELATSGHRSRIGGDESGAEVEPTGFGQTEDGRLAVKLDEYDGGTEGRKVAVSLGWATTLKVLDVGEGRRRPERGERQRRPVHNPICRFFYRK